MRKGFSLIELLILIMTIPILMVFIDRFFGTLISQTPRIWNNVQQNTTLINMLGQLQNDIDKATDFPESKADFTSSDKLLLIEQPDALIGYEFGDKKIVRKILTGSLENASRQKTWVLPDAKIEWKIFKKNGKGYCLEFHNRIEYPKSNGLENQMPNSHLFFIGAL